MLKKCASRIYMVLIFAFLYLPIIVLIALSFNDSRSKVKWGGFTLRWYTGCFQDEKIMTAFVTTLQVTFLSAIISTLIGTLAALGIAAMKKRHQTISRRDQYSASECGYRNRYLHDAFVCEIYRPRICDGSSGAHYF